MPLQVKKNTIVTNGMSNFARNGLNANSAVLVNVTPDDFSDISPLAGMYFQKDLEEKAFILGGSIILHLYKKYLILLIIKNPLLLVI